MLIIDVLRGRRLISPTDARAWRLAWIQLFVITATIQGALFFFCGLYLLRR